MLRFLLSPRQLAVHAVALMLVTAMAWLCWWQLGKAQHRDPSPPSLEQAVDLEAVSQAGQWAPQAFNQPVLASGRYRYDQTVSIPGRILNGQAGAWVITPLQLGEGSVVAVVRGWTQAPLPSVSSGPSCPNPARGECLVTVTGQFLPPEQAPTRPEGTAARQVAAVDLAQLTPLWGNPPLHEGYLLAAHETPSPTDLGILTLTRIPPTNAQTSDTGAPFSNASYAVQWLAFSGFVLFLWWRILRDGWRKQNENVPAKHPATTTA